MEIFKELYMGNVSEVSRARKIKNKNHYEKEKQLYEKLTSKLAEEDKFVFEEFIDAYGTSLDEEMIDKYIQGLKTGILIGIEASNIDF